MCFSGCTYPNVIVDTLYYGCTCECDRYSTFIIVFNKETNKMAKMLRFYLLGWGGALIPPLVVLLADSSHMFTAVDTSAAALVLSSTVFSARSCKQTII